MHSTRHWRRPFRAVPPLLLLVALLTMPVASGVARAQPVATPIAQATPVAMGPSPGAPGIGDPYFPLLGNGGYDALHYGIDLDLDVEAGSLLDASTTMYAIATQDLSAFNLDFRGPTIDEITVNGTPAAWERRRGELTITPATPLLEGESFQSVVRYHGTPDGGDGRFERGWWATGDSVFTVGEPAGADVWYPVNGHPLDKATYTLSITVPEPYDVVANGRLAELAIADGAAGHPTTRTFTWENDEPTASYLVMFHAAELDVETVQGPGGVTLTEAFPPDLPEADRRIFARVPEMLETFAELFGPYPFAALGNTVFTDTDFNAALETQGMIGYDRSAVREPTVAHEIAHQWFGNSVSPARWQDIWLNEGLARYGEVIWAERAYGAEAAEMTLRRQMSSFANASRTTDDQGVLIGDPGPDRLFSEAVYAGGALMMHDLRQRLGDEIFFELLQTWAARYQHGNASAEDFIALASEVSGEAMEPFFTEWLYTPWTAERVAERYSLTGTPISEQAA